MSNGVQQHSTTLALLAMVLAGVVRDVDHRGECAAGLGCLLFSCSRHQP